jgi:DnaJ-class molecular chaperone
VTEFYIVLIIGAGILGYVGSLLINPYVTCSRCGGSPKKRGSIFSYAHHFCPKCKGTGQQLRFGRRFLGPPK